MTTGGHPVKLVPRDRGLTVALFVLLGCAGCESGQVPIPPPVTSPSPATRVTALPAERGGETTGGHSQSLGTSLHLGGRARTMKQGMFGVRVHKKHPGELVLNLEISIKAGRLRAYMKEREGSFYYVEATPGRPARTRGVMDYRGSGYYFYLEAVEDCEDMEWHVWHTE